MPVGRPRKSRGSKRLRNHKESRSRNKAKQKQACRAETRVLNQSNSNEFRPEFYFDSIDTFDEATVET